MLYNMLSECCIEYITLYNFTEDFRVVFRFLAHLYIWANSRVAMAQPGVMVTVVKMMFNIPIVSCNPIA